MLRALFAWNVLTVRAKMLAIFEFDPKPWEQHRNAVAALRHTIEETARIRADSSFRAPKAAYNAPSDIPGFDKIVQLDFDTSTAWVEPNVTMRTLVQATLDHGLVPAVVAASETVSVADAFAATTTESSSFTFGTFDCTVLSMEMILSNGQYVMARTDDRKTADLLWGSAGALHSLGLTTLLEIVLIPAERGHSGPHLSMLDLSKDFVEIIMFGSSSGLAIIGRFTPTTGRACVLQSLKGNSFSRHARSVWRDLRFAHKRRVELLPVMEYLFRHDNRRRPACGKRRSRDQKSNANFGDEAFRALLAMARWSGGYESHTGSDTCIVARPAVKKRCGSSTTIGGTAHCDRDGRRKVSPTDLLALLDALDVLKTATVQRILDLREYSTAQVQSNHAIYDSALFCANENEETAYSGFINQEPQYCNDTNPLERGSARALAISSPESPRRAAEQMDDCELEDGEPGFFDEAFGGMISEPVYPDSQIEEIPLSVQLIRGLLYTLLPAPLQILELNWGNCAQGLLACTESAENFAAIIVQRINTRPLLILGDVTTRTIFVIASETEHPDLLGVIESSLDSWKSVCIDLDHALLSVHIAEACFGHLLPITDVPASRALRLRFLGELVAPYERESVLERCGIPGKIAPLQNVDTRVIAARLPSGPHGKLFHIPNLVNFDTGTLTKAFLERPPELSSRRCLRIVQYVNAIGSPHVLQSIQSALDRRPQEETVQAVDEPIFERLIHIHLYLGGLESQDHLLVARHRYIKYCYFETYWLAVRELQQRKWSGRRERKRMDALKLTASYKQGLYEGPFPTSRTDGIPETTQKLSHTEKKGRAADIVKGEIVRKVANVYKYDEKRIRADINRYIREGEVLHKILQGTVRVNPGLLVLFPSRELHPPSLDIDQFALDLEHNERNSLAKPLALKDIDNLALVEASWFATVLQARPALLEPLPKSVLSLLSKSATDYAHLRVRDPNLFSNEPLQFIAS
ncbi:24-dehydrocholesterol reductase precursor [Paraphaeosphaeria minitans]|uniref:Delta(24)-sterol reductase n=1 Tax=Paraphaeosphaeria minitans TaxID=565426 RepID=A0A9P6G814_9PLEO|nr:24-dehydrocholesterol reductase precursor [Paraphaeosphaeria minitans]